MDKMGLTIAGGVLSIVGVLVSIGSGFIKEKQLDLTIDEKVNSALDSKLHGFDFGSSNTTSEV